MDFTSAAFVCFLAVVAGLYALAPVRLRPVLLLIASYGFYLTWSRWFALLLLFSSLLAFFAAKVGRGLILIAGAWLIGIVIYFKSVPLLPSALRIAIPIGISYYTFKLLSYLIDVHWGSLQAETRLIPFLASAAFFPQMVAGPIQRPASLLPEVAKAESASEAMVVLGVMRILLGFFKKFVIADSLSTIASAAYHGGDVPAFLGFYGYPFQMYADFSALSDIAIGAALLMGIASPENFDAPFAAASPSVFWRRWHMTLTTWLTDYVFTPLRMSVREWGNAGLAMSISVNMILIGLWHGFKWTFLVFGLLQALYLCVDALTLKQRKQFFKKRPGASRAMDWVGAVFTFHLMAISMVAFRAGSLAEVTGFFWRLVTEVHPGSIFAGAAASLPWVAAGYLLMEFFDYLRRHNPHAEFYSKLPRWGRWSVNSCAAIAVVLLLILLLGNGRARNPFIYAVF